MGENQAQSTNFIHAIIEQDLASGKYGGKVITRFPPEPNGYLHIGHAKSICLNFGLAKEFGGQCNLRFDDTNPAKEEVEYVDSIQEDVRWLGFSWDDRMFYASNYFDRLYAFAETLIEKLSGMVARILRSMCTTSTPVAAACAGCSPARSPNPRWRR